MNSYDEVATKILDIVHRHRYDKYTQERMCSDVLYDAYFEDPEGKQGRIDVARELVSRGHGALLNWRAASIGDEFYGLPNLHIQAVSLGDLHTSVSYALGAFNTEEALGNVIPEMAEYTTCGISYHVAAAWLIYGSVGLYLYSTLIAEVRLMDLYRTMMPDTWGMLNILPKTLRCMSTLLGYGWNAQRLGSGGEGHLIGVLGMEALATIAKGGAPNWTPWLMKDIWWDVVTVPLSNWVESYVKSGGEARLLDMAGEGEWYWARMHAEAGSLTKELDAWKGRYLPWTLLSCIGLVNDVRMSEWPTSPWSDSVQALDMVGLHLALGHGPWSSYLLHVLGPHKRMLTQAGDPSKTWPYLLSPL